MVFTLEPNSREYNLEQSLNAEFPIFVTLLPIRTVLSSVQPENSSDEISVFVPEICKCRNVFLLLELSRLVFPELKLIFPPIYISSNGQELNKDSDPLDPNVSVFSRSSMTSFFRLVHPEKT